MTLIEYIEKESGMNCPEWLKETIERYFANGYGSEPVDDTISRKAAIDAVFEAFCYAYCDNCEKNLDEDLCGDCHRKYQNWSASKKTIEKVINALPSAQPDVPDTNVGDMISRQAVIDAIVAWTVEDRPDAEMPTDLVGRINALPSAQPSAEYERGWKEGREALREETWEYVGDRFD